MEFPAINAIAQWLSANACSIPFMTITTSNGKSIPAFLRTRVIEAVIIAGMSAAITTYVTVQTLGVRLNDMQQQLVEIKAHSFSVDSKLYSMEHDIARIQGQLDKGKP